MKKMKPSQTTPSSNNKNDIWFAKLAPYFDLDSKRGNRVIWTDKNRTGSKLSTLIRLWQRPGNQKKPWDFARFKKIVLYVTKSRH